MTTNMQLLQLSIITLFATTLKAEILVYDGTVSAPSIIECTDASTPCFITCTAAASCQSKEVHCHRTAQKPCTIYVGSSDYSSIGRDSSYFTHQAPTVNITAIGRYAMFQSVIYAHEALKSKVYLAVNGLFVFEGSTIFAPVDETSLLSIKCKGGNACTSLRIYDDWTTEVRIEAEGGSQQLLISNIFDDSPLNISRNDSNYIALNSAYRAPVFLSGFGTQTFTHMRYFGHNHGDWTLYGAGAYSFHSALIEATADIPAYNKSFGYKIKLIATSDSEFGDFILNASQCAHGPNISAEIKSSNGLSDARIYAKNANSVEIHCTEGGDCDGLMVECPLDNMNCTILCDDDAQTDCSNMKIYTCSHTDILCDGIDCNFAATKVFCGLDQNETFYEAGSGDVSCQNYSSGSCMNECAQETNEPTEEPTSDPLINVVTTRDTDTTAADEATTVVFNEAPVNDRTTTATEDSKEAEKEDIEQNEKDVVIIALIAVSSSILAVCGIICCIYFYGKKERKKRLKEAENMVIDDNKNGIEMNAKKEVINTNTIDVIQSTDVIIGEDDEIFDDDDESDADELYIAAKPNITKSTTGSTESDDNNDLYIAQESVPGSNDDDDNEYKLINSMLKACDGEQWKKYLENFKKEKVNDSRLKFIESKTDPIWDKLIPEWGLKMEFISIFTERKKCVETMIQ